ncbi:hypothetical protein MAXJ12_32219 [Mesorhizobium alhagi CCNWXJ12-2]|uniref:Uncharacterized protein n=1 Tax=Mesorhizobium alhagi CCNWXJ12-2 TaxID=1107882 RepID=H0I1V2_9HYPH|nr:hypothetical protein MAXJ12_32219 [Mesorhizobium alhagi CCNWXJ12-2]
MVGGACYAGSAKHDVLFPGVEHRDPARGDGRGHLVLQHVPMLGQLAVLDPEDVKR